MAALDGAQPQQESVAFHHRPPRADECTNPVQALRRTGRTHSCPMGCEGQGSSCATPTGNHLASYRTNCCGGGVPVCFCAERTLQELSGRPSPRVATLFRIEKKTSLTVPIRV